MRGDLDLDPAMWERAGVTATKPAAVLIPVVERAEPMVLLTQRTVELPSHPGQIAFPGGKIDQTDANPLAAALREADEEIGLDRLFVDPIGYLDLYLTLSGLSYLAGGGARGAGLFADAQRRRSVGGFRSAARLS